MSNIKRFLLPGCLFLGVMIFIAFPFRNRIIHKMKVLIGNAGGGSRVTGVCYGCAEIFTDNVKTQQRAYKNEGIIPQSDDDSLDKLFKINTLIEVKTDSLYSVRQLLYSKPYISPKGFVFIRDLAQGYYSRCIADSLNYVSVTISSLTRSRESVSELMEDNSNAIKNSAHLKGKTFDVSYRAFDDNIKQTRAFINTLETLHSKGRCYVKYERNGCLHITVI